MVIIPTQADIYGIQGILSLNSVIDRVRKEDNSELKIGGILLTRYNGRTNLTKELTTELQKLAAELNTKVFKTPIRESISVKEAQLTHTPLIEYAPNGNATEDYKAFIEELKADIGRSENEL